jgi:hypothetical protein
MTGFCVHGDESSDSKTRYLTSWVSVKSAAQEGFCVVCGFSGASACKAICAYLLLKKSKTPGEISVPCVVSYLCGQSVCAILPISQPLNSPQRHEMDWTSSEQSNGRLLWTWSSTTACAAVLSLLLGAGGGTHGTSWPVTGTHLLHLRHYAVHTHRSNFLTHCKWT